MEATGRITQVMGPVVDVEFPANAVPHILNAVTATNNAEQQLVNYLTKQRDLVVESDVA